MRTLMSIAVGLLALVSLTFVSAQNARDAANAGSDRSAEVKVFRPDEVAASFEKGGTLMQAANYKVMTIRRDAAGEVEIHNKFTDVFYIVSGSATIMVGGKATGLKSSEPNELRGTSIEGGQLKQLSAGEVVIIPAGVPHWINSVSPPFRYFVVKVAAAAP